jgi:oligopeptide transport system permease protein
MMSLIVLFCLVLTIVVVPMFYPYSYEQMITVNGKRDKTSKNLAPMTYSKNELKAMEEGQKIFPHLFGTDELCRDYFIRVVYGARVSLAVGLFASLIVLVIGLVYGSVSGYFGGMLDNVMQRFVEIANSVPRLVIVSVLAIFMPKGMGLVIVALLLTEWIGMSKIARAEMLKIKEQEYVLASRTLGAGSGHIIFKSILPNTIGPIITQVMFSIPTAIFTEAFLSFVGVGIVLPECSVGTLIEDGFNNITTLPYQILPPILVLALLMLGFNFIGDGLREALAPKLEDM